MNVSPNQFASSLSPQDRARAVVGARAHEQAQSFEIARDRVLITLLALNLMLVAFFVVLNSSASFDKARISAVAQSMQTILARAEKPAPAANIARRTAAATLRTAVAEAFAPFVPPNQLPAETLAGDRIDVNVSPSTLFTTEGSLLGPAPLLDNVARIVAAAPANFRTELFIGGTSEQISGGGLAALANALVARGVAPTQLYVGTHSDAAAPQGASIAFTFMLLDADEIGVARLVAKRGKAAP